MKSVTNYVIEWMGLNFDVFPGFQQIPCYAQYYVIQCILKILVSAANSADSEIFDSSTLVYTFNFWPKQLSTVSSFTLYCQ